MGRMVRTMLETILHIELIFIFVFSYAENAPSRLSYHDFVLGLAMIVFCSISTTGFHSFHDFLDLEVGIKNIFEANWMFIH